MQPLYNGVSCIAVIRGLTRSCRPTKDVHALIRRSHEGARLMKRHASSRTPNPSKKSSAKALPYQPAQSKAQQSARARQGQQQQQEQRQQERKRNQKAPIADLVRERWLAILGFGSALGCLGYFTASLAIYWRSDPAPYYPLGCEPTVPTGRPSIQSPYEFDLHLDKSEWRYGITRLRREIGAEVKGHVLEVAIGTGRNLEFYNWDKVTESLATPEQRKKALAKGKSSGWLPGSKAPQKDDGAVVSFTGVDISPGMLDIALLRTRQVIPHMADEIPKKPSFAILAAKQNSSEKPQQQEGHVVSLLSGRIRLVQSDVQSGLPAPLSLSATQKYDTILQTFGLCSVQDPVSLLSHMASSLQPDTGRIILLEHGRSVWDIVNGLLDRGARAHHERFGCWWNRDIEVIVNEASRRIPGLEILRLERPGWATAGTHVVVELRVKAANAESEGERPERKATGWASVLPSLPSLLSTKGDDEPKKPK
ncbi:hypothetical protein GGR55DRAFT_670060 [Xylaria sp. FL0064]|nr:hypothetical protein GGR55DRAFT_670060 [Xylaria sp. FL0064]